MRMRATAPGSPVLSRVPRLIALRVLVATLALLATASFVPVGAAAAPGDLDQSFGSGGRVATPVDSAAFANGIDRQEDGKLVVAGCASDAGGVGRFMFARYESDGSLDSSFGSGGTVLIPLGASASACAEDVALQADGKIVAVGRSNGSAGSRFMVVRVNADGTPDATFGDDGKVSVSPGIGSSEATAVGLQSDGKIVVAGDAAFDPDPSDFDGRAVQGFAVVSQNSDGQHDASFGSGGTSTVALTSVSGSGGAGANAFDLLVDPGGKIVAGGVAVDDWPDDSTGSRWRFALIRFNSNGSLDATFDGDGKVVHPIRSTDGFAYGTSLARQSDGKIVMAGSYFAVLGGDNYGPRSWLVARFTDQGALDSSFGSVGSTVVPLGGSSASSGTAPWDLAVQPDGKIVAAGTADDAESGPCDIRFAAARLTSGGSLDSSFSSDGTVEGPPFEGSDPWCRAYGRALSLDAGRLVVAGYVGVESRTHIGLARYVADALPPQAPLSYVALGDSVAAGEGLEYGWRWDNEARRWRRDGSGEPTSWDTNRDPLQLCHRSAGAYPQLVRSRLVPQPELFEHFACTGALAARGLLRSQEHEGSPVLSPRQLGSDRAAPEGEEPYAPPYGPYDNADPDLVTLSLGANDIEFASELANCFDAYKDDCNDDPATVARVTENLRKQRAALREVLTEIRERGKAAGRVPLVAVNTYYDPFPFEYRYCPDLYPLGTDFAGGIGYLLSNNEVEFLRTKLKNLSQNIVAEASAFPNVVVVDLEGAMRGHEFCSRDPWVHGPSIRAPFGGNDEDSPAPFHPTAAGQDEIADRVVPVLNGAQTVKVGSNIETVSPSGVRLRFDQVGGAGAVVVLTEGQLSADAPPNPNFEKRVLFDISSSATFTGTIRISIPSPEARTLYHYTNGQWQAVPSTYEGGYVSGYVTSLSPFALGSPAPAVSARFNVDGEGAAPADITFDASGSRVEDGSTPSYEWDFGDGTVGAGSSPTHRYATAGRYDVTLRVISDRGAAAETERSVLVTNPPPEAVLRAPSTASQGEPVSFDGSSSSDPNGPLSDAVWDFGDGSDSVVGSTVQHTFDTPGTYSVVLTVLDSEGAADTATSEVLVKRPDPEPLGGELPGPSELPPVFQPPGALLDVTAPTLGPIRLSRRVLVTPTGRRRRQPHVSIRFLTNERSSVVFLFRGEVRCRKPRPGCRRLRLAGRLKMSARPGANTLRFTGKVGGRYLPSRRYRIEVQAVDASGNRSRVRTARLTVKRR